uniref:IF rod domain-containing protein n=1 Tax=Erpetoichthys calabaricus TaxID=27687 RepID=A0A8C4TIY3_ERPCA
MPPSGLPSCSRVTSCCRRSLTTPSSPFHFHIRGGMAVHRCHGHNWLLLREGPRCPTHKLLHISATAEGHDRAVPVRSAMWADISTYSSRVLPSELLRRPPSVCGGAGGQSVSISRSSQSMALSGTGGGFFFMPSISSAPNGKEVMQKLNERLASYLEKVHTLELANSSLEQNIREWYKQQTPMPRDLSEYERTVASLQDQFDASNQHNTQIVLQIDNAKLAADDYKMKCLSMRQAVEADTVGLKKLLDELTFAKNTLDKQVEELKEERLSLKKNHTEEMNTLLAKQGTTINVEVDAVPGVDLKSAIAEIRAQYEEAVERNQQETEAWYKKKFDDLNQQVSSSTEELQSGRSQLAELKRTIQSLEIEVQSLISLKQALEGSLHETEQHNYTQLSELQNLINQLEAELAQLKGDASRQDEEYKALLDLKTRHELEIQEYRRLLDMEDKRGLRALCAGKWQDHHMQGHRLKLAEICPAVVARELQRDGGL